VENLVLDLVAVLVVGNEVVAATFVFVVFAAAAAAGKVWTAGELRKGLSLLCHCAPL